LADLFRALSEETRVQMIALLLEGQELCVCDFVNVLGITQSKASRHLRYLDNGGLLEDRRNGVWVRYRIRSDADEATRAVLRAIETGLDERSRAELSKRLADWRLRKYGAQVVCG
jgi:ArsR family transcriptional regulator